MQCPLLGVKRTSSHSITADIVLASAFLRLAPAGKWPWTVFDFDLVLEVA
jgi:hypothetical protein